MTGAAGLDALRLRGDVPPVVTVAGVSMAPGLPPGARLRVVPLDGPLAVGDVVVLRGGAASASAFVVHRVAGIDARDGLVAHRGDAGGRVGFAPSSALVGRVAARLDAPDARVPSPSDLDPAAARAFGRAAARCRAYLALRSWARRLGVAGLGALARRLLLGG